MIVILLDATEDPIDIVSKAAGTCYGKTNWSEKRVKRCIDNKHWSVLEHAKATFQVNGISRACSHQLVRHRLASYSQLSQRYSKIDVAGNTDWYVAPPSILGSALEDTFREKMRAAGNGYLTAIKSGIAAEDARYFLPEATKTNITVTMNLRELANFHALRTDRAAQWEIHELADLAWKTLSEHSRKWKDILAMICGTYEEQDLPVCSICGEPIEHGFVEDDSNTCICIKDFTGFRFEKDLTNGNDA